jgi:hypothetical protein
MLNRTVTRTSQEERDHTARGERTPSVHPQPNPRVAVMAACSMSKADGRVGINTRSATAIPGSIRSILAGPVSMKAQSHFSASRAWGSWFCRVASTRMTSFPADRDRSAQLSDHPRPPSPPMRCTALSCRYRPWYQPASQRACAAEDAVVSETSVPAVGSWYQVGTNLPGNLTASRGKPKETSEIGATFHRWHAEVRPLVPRQCRRTFVASATSVHGT